MKLYYVFGEDQLSEESEPNDLTMVVAADDPDEAFRLWTEFWADNADSHEMEMSEYSILCFQGMRLLELPATPKVLTWTTDKGLVPRIVAIKRAEAVLDGEFHAT